MLRSSYVVRGHQLLDHVNKALEKVEGRKDYTRPALDSDRLYQTKAVHPKDSSRPCIETCGDGPEYLEDRPERDGELVIHYGLIASGNLLMKDARLRNILAAERDVLCFEMEAAGLMNHFPCLVIRGICDYSDSHKNSQWQGFAAMVAAAYARDLLQKVAPNSVEAERPISKISSSS